MVTFEPNGPNFYKMQGSMGQSNKAKYFPGFDKNVKKVHVEAECFANGNVRKSKFVCKFCFEK